MSDGADGKDEEGADDGQDEDAVGTTTLRLVGTVPPEAWNRIGFKILAKMKSGVDLQHTGNPHEPWVFDFPARL